MQNRTRLLRLPTLLVLVPAIPAAEAGAASPVPGQELISDADWNRSTSTRPVGAGEVSGKGLLGIGLSLVLVLALAVALGWVVKRLGVRRLLPQKGRHLEVLDTVPLAFKRQVSLVRVGDQAVLVGVGEHELTCLALVPIASLSTADGPIPSPAAPVPVPTPAEPPAGPADPGQPGRSAFAETLAQRLRRAP